MIALSYSYKPVFKINNIIRLLSYDPKVLPYVTDPSLYSIEVNEMHQHTVNTAIRHCQTIDTYLSNKFISNHTLNAYIETTNFVNKFYNNKNNQSTIEQIVILDSGCGKGMSTIQLAEKYPNIPIIGIDKSIHRLSKNKIYNMDKNNEANIDENTTSDKINDDEALSNQLTNNCLLIRAELVDFWILALQSNWVIHSHYILYPNPYPKSKHLQRRWHGHPSFPVLLILGGYLEIRSNWNIYCEEMFTSISEVFENNAIKGLSYNNLAISEVEGSAEPITHFERKYKLANVKLFKLTVDLPVSNLTTRQKVLSLNKLNK